MEKPINPYESPRGDELADELASESNPRLVFEDYCRRKNLELATYVVAAITLTPVLVSVGVEYSLPSIPTWFTLIVSAVVTQAVYVLLAHFLHSSGSALRKLIARFGQNETVASLYPHYVVGCAQSDRIRYYYDNKSTVWDAGFLFLYRQSIVFRGTKEVFKLPRACVIQVAQGTGISWLYPWRAYVQWESAPGVVAEWLQFVVAGDDSLFRLRSRGRKLIADLEHWHRMPEHFPLAPESEAELPLPGPVPVHGPTVRQVGLSFSCLIGVCAIAAGAFCTRWFIGEYLMLDSRLAWIPAAAATLSLLATLLPEIFHNEGLITSPTKLSHDH